MVGHRSGTLGSKFRDLLPTGSSRLFHRPLATAARTLGFMSTYSTVHRSSRRTCNTSSMELLSPVKAVWGQVTQVRGAESRPRAELGQRPPDQCGLDHDGKVFSRVVTARGYQLFQAQEVFVQQVLHLRARQPLVLVLAKETGAAVRMGEDARDRLLPNVQKNCHVCKAKTVRYERTHAIIGN